MASKFLVYIAVICVSCIAFCIVDSCLNKSKNCKVGDTTAKHGGVYMVLKNRICRLHLCENAKYSFLHFGCYLKGKCYKYKQRVNGKKCSQGGRWT
ncbi:hypothetical protein PoB_001780400 [Plakobranchus ocellatus]|uniref:Uncharacterized protein n=1 Tax=Plakobranchus ocellatus TaxID=259542 RepID=A0AAV3ZBF8_9GAST|nr:hypothetical protein PoB_001780400 [Plakobranchus ocellatus]